MFPKNGTNIDKLQFISNYAILAPSGHNSQPWSITKTNGSLLLRLNKDHYISGDKSGLLRVEPYVSLGAFIETFILAARGFGYKIDLRLFPEKNVIAEFSMGNSIKKDSELLNAIKKRVSSRNNFRKDEISESIKNQILSTSFSGVATTEVSKREQISSVANLTETAVSKIMSNISYRRELGEWVRNNITKKKDGMPGFTHGVKLIPSLFAKFGIIYASKLGPPPSHSSELIENSALLLIVGYQKNDKLSHIGIGRTYASAAITAAKCGFSSSALGAAAIDPGTRKILIKQFDLNYRPVIILRFGVSDTQARHSPRWPVSEITT